MADPRLAAETDERNSDNWWWLTVRNPNQEIHLYELGFAEDVELPTGEFDDEGAPVTEMHNTALTPDRRTVIMAELGAPAHAGEPGSGWDLAMAPGRPNRYLEPKEYDERGQLLPIRARAGVTLHLMPQFEPGTAEANGETASEEDVPVGDGE